MITCSLTLVNGEDSYPHSSRGFLGIAALRKQATRSQNRCEVKVRAVDKSVVVPCTECVHATPAVRNRAWLNRRPLGGVSSALVLVVTTGRISYRKTLLPSSSQPCRCQNRATHFQAAGMSRTEKVYRRTVSGEEWSASTEEAQVPQYEKRKHSHRCVFGSLEGSGEHPQARGDGGRYSKRQLERYLVVAGKKGRREPKHRQPPYTAKTEKSEQNTIIIGM